jgi:hypothetical protein
LTKVAKNGDKLRLSPVDRGSDMQLDQFVLCCVCKALGAVLQATGGAAATEAAATAAAPEAAPEGAAAAAATGAGDHLLMTSQQHQGQEPQQSSSNIDSSSSSSGHVDTTQGTAAAAAAAVDIAVLSPWLALLGSAACSLQSWCVMRWTKQQQQQSLWRPASAKHRVSVGC